MRSLALARTIGGGIGALAIGLMVISGTAVGEQGEHAVTCTNPASGATWQIRIDYDRNTVDANRARIRAGDITWHDANDNGNYTLDRKTGNLTSIVASSTGGAFFYGRCNLDR
ncbi:MAG: hypothetical protein J2P47_14235 [Acetobacteraceae bacterium]|nr:hypothetical protein [Acetobacteraceae bacterium]